MCCWPKWMRCCSPPARWWTPDSSFASLSVVSEADGRRLRLVPVASWAVTPICPGVMPKQQIMSNGPICAGFAPRLSKRALLFLFCGSLAGGCVPRTFVGTVVPDHAGPACAASRGVLQIDRGRFVFSPNEGVITLSGPIGPLGQLVASQPLHPVNGASSNGPAPAGLPAPRLALDATLSGNMVQGRYEAAECRAKLRLYSR